jgi:hypothetical protein
MDLLCNSRSTLMLDYTHFLLYFAAESPFTKIWMFETGGVLFLLTLSTTFTWIIISNGYAFFFTDMNGTYFVFLLRLYSKHGPLLYPPCYTWQNTTSQRKINHSKMKPEQCQNSCSFRDKWDQKTMPGVHSILPTANNRGSQSILQYNN